MIIQCSSVSFENNELNTELGCDISVANSVQLEHERLYKSQKSQVCSLLLTHVGQLGAFICICIYNNREGLFKQQNEVLIAVGIACSDATARTAMTARPFFL